MPARRGEPKRIANGLAWGNFAVGEGFGHFYVAEGVGFEPTRERNPLPVFKTGALNHSATLPIMLSAHTLLRRPMVVLTVLFPH
jgi:hypothetical protein